MTEQERQVPLDGPEIPEIPTMRSSTVSAGE